MPLPSFRSSISHNPHNMLHNQRYNRYRNPAAQPQENRAHAVLYQGHEVGIQPDGCHGPDDAELAEIPQPFAHLCRQDAAGIDNGSHHKPQNEERKNPL